MLKKKWPPKKDSPENRELAFNYSLKYLSFRPRSTKEVFDYLIKKNFCEESANDALKRLIDLKFLNDEEFAERWIEQRQKYKGKSKFIIRNELIQKGISKDVISNLLNRAHDDIDSAKIAYQKKLRILGKLPKEEFNKKISAYLSRRGYSWDIISKLLKKD